MTLLIKQQKQCPQKILTKKIDSVEKTRNVCNGPLQEATEHYSALKEKTKLFLSATSCTTPANEIYKAVELLTEFKVCVVKNSASK